MPKHLRLEIARLRREQYGHSSERRARLIDQMELQLEELEAAATEDEIAAEKAAKTTTVAGFERRRPARKPFPDHLPRERVVIEAPSACSCCGSERIVKMGEDVTETLEVIPRQWKVIGFGVSAASVSRWRALERRQGDARPGPLGGDRRSARVEAQSGLIKALLEATPDITVEELRAALVERGHAFGYGTLQRFFRRHGITRKKRRRTPPSRSGPTS